MKNFKMFIVWIVLAFLIGFMCGCADFKNVDVRITDTSGKVSIYVDSDIYIIESNGDWITDYFEIDDKTFTHKIRKDKIQEITIILKRDNNGK